MIEPMSPEELRACRERAEAATPGDLSVAREDEEHGAITYAVVRGGLTLAFVPEDTRGKWEKSSAKADAAFWASARADVLRLLATIAARDAEIANLRACVESLQESAEMSCITPADDCQCSGCLYAAEVNERDEEGGE